MSYNTEQTNTVVEKSCDDITLTFKKVVDEDKFTDYESWHLSVAGNTILLGRSAAEVLEFLNWLRDEASNITEEAY